MRCFGRPPGTMPCNSTSPSTSSKYNAVPSKATKYAGNMTISQAATPPTLANHQPNLTLEKRPPHHLLGRALDAFRMRVSVLLVIIERVSSAKGPGPGRAVDVFQIRGLGHSLIWRSDLECRSREDLPQRVERGWILTPVLFGKLDVELDVHVSMVVVSV